MLTIDTQANVTVLAATTVIAAANVTRKGLVVQNQSSGNVWIGLDIPAVVDAGFVLAPGKSADIGQGFASTGNGTDFFEGAVNGIFEAHGPIGSADAATTGVVRVLEVS